MERHKKTEPRNNIEQASIETIDWERYYRQLDTIGIVGSEMLTKLFELHKQTRPTPDDIQQVLDTIDTTTLSQTQRTLLEQLRTQILQDQATLLQDIDAVENSTDVIRATLSTYIRNLPESILNQATIRPLIGGACITLHPYDYKKLNDQLGYPSNAVFIRSTKPDPHPLETPMIISTNTPDDVIRHEHMHLLMHRYIEPHELPVPESPEITRCKTQIDDLTARLAEITEEISYADDVEDIPSLERARQQIERTLKKERERLQTHYLERNTHTDQHSLRLYRDIRDELCAYLQEGKIQTKVARLIPPQRGTWEDRIAAISPTERQQFEATWERVTTYLTLIEKEQLFPILISSPSLYVLAERLGAIANPILASNERYDTARDNLLSEIDTYLDSQFPALYDQLCHQIPEIHTLSEEDKQTLQDILRPKMALDWIESDISTHEQYDQSVIDGIALELNASRLPSLLGQDEHIVDAIHTSPLSRVLDKIHGLHPTWNI